MQEPKSPRSHRETTSRPLVPAWRHISQRPLAAAGAGTALGYLAAVTPGPWWPHRSLAATTAAAMALLGLSWERPWLLVVGPALSFGVVAALAPATKPLLPWALGLAAYVLFALVWTAPTTAQGARAKRWGRGNAAGSAFAVLAGVLLPAAVGAAASLEPELVLHWGKEHRAAQVFLGAVAFAWAGVWLYLVAMRPLRLGSAPRTHRILWRLRLRPRATWAWLALEAALAVLLAGLGARWSG